MPTFAPVKQLLSCLILVLGCFLQARGEDYSDPFVNRLLTLGLPVVEVMTVDEEEPTYEDADPPEGCLGGSIRNAVKVPGRVVVRDSTGVLYDSGDYEKAVSGMTVKVRGNWSARRPKKPYKIKLQRAANMLLPIAAGHADRNWLLMPFFDLSYMIGQKVCELMDMGWTPQFRFVNLVFNREFRGLYMLMESVERNPRCRLDVAESGFIAELDAYWWNEDVYAEAGFEEPLNYTFKYPDPDDMTATRLDSIQRVLTAAEASLADSTCLQHIDVESFARWMLTHDILGNRDGAGSNMFFTKYDDNDTTLLRMGCLWDFDVIMQSEGWDELHDRYYFGALFRSADRTFTNHYISLWDEYKDSVFDAMQKFFDDYLASTQRQAIDASIRLNNNRWARVMYVLPYSADFIDEAKLWFDSRKPWMDEAVHGITAIQAAAQRDPHTSSLFTLPSSLFDLHGRRLSAPPSHGIYIRNGRKYVK